MDLASGRGKGEKSMNCRTEGGKPMGTRHGGRVMVCEGEKDRGKANWCVLRDL